MEFSVEEGQLECSFGDQKRLLKTCRWIPQEKVRALVFVCHGYAERLRPYYDELCEAGARQGFLCSGHDHTGHGESQGERVQVSGFDEYVTPVLEHCNNLKREYNNIPLFIIGHSLGGLITLSTVLKDKDIVDGGLVLMGPLVELDPNVGTPFKVFIAQLLGSILPSFTMGGIDPEQVTQDKAWIENIKQDSLRWHGGWKAKHGMVIIQRLKELPPQLGSISTPFLILHGERDQLCTVSGSHLLHSSATSQDKLLKIIENGQHHLFIEEETIRHRAIAETWLWINHRSNMEPETQ